MGGTLKDIVRQGAAPPEAFGFSRGSSHRTQMGGTGRNSTAAEDGPIQRMPKNKQA